MKRKGSILIIVLWSLFILGALAVAISGYVRAQIAVAGKLLERSTGYYTEKALIEKAIAGIRTTPAKSYDAMDDLWGAAYGLTDEESKINVNKAPRDVLKNFFVVAGEVDESEADKIAASIINWRSPAEQANADGANAFHYQALDRPYRAKNAAIDALEELLQVEGVSQKIFNKIKSRATIYGNGAVNVNTADELVLRSLGMSEELAKKIVDFRAKDEEKPKEPENSPALAARNYFDNTANIAALLAKKGSISDEESGKISSLTAAGLLSVKSDNFGGTAVNKTADKIAVSPAVITKITFVFDRKNDILRYWSE